MTRFATLLTLLLVPALAFAQKDLGVPASASGGSPDNDNLADATTITGNAIYNSSVTGATSETSEVPASCTFGGTANDTGNSVWWVFTPEVSGSVTLDTEDSLLDDGSGGFVDTLISILTGSGHPLTEVACNDDDPANTGADFTSRLDFNANAGTTYFIRVSTFNGGRTEGAIQLSFNGPALVANEEAPEVQTLSLGPVVPNPTAGPADLAVSVDEPQTIDIAVFDVLGRRVLDVYAGTATGDLALTINTRTLRSGVYVIRAMGEASTLVRSFTVTR